MRPPRLYGSVAALVAGMLAATACQTAQKPAAFLAPTHAAPPALMAGASGSGGHAAPPQAQAQVAPPPAQPSQLNPPHDAATDLIARVEREYKSGEENYRSGHLEAAKQNFDRAFDLLLTSDLDVHADARLQREFDTLVDRINSLEVQALQQGDGFAERKSEPAPIDEANEVTFPVDPKVKAQAEVELKSTHSDLPLMLTDPVASYISYFSSRGHGTIERALARSGRYREMIRRVFKEEGVPQDLIYLAQAESGFHPTAVSRAGARGIWQFMAWRGASYGLDRTWWVDDRQDPEKSTHAAARHLKDLFNQFGDWYLAMAAYNSGPGTVQHAVKRTGYADYWELYRRNVLPKETRNYVPIILAVTIMAKNPRQYGLEDVQWEQPVPFDTVKVDYPVDLRLVAECVDASVDDLQDLNPSLLRLTTPKDEQFELKLPQGTADKFQTAIAAVPVEMRVWWRYHKVKPGDTLPSVARAYHTSTQAIAEANNLEGDELSPDSKLVIPVAPGKHVSPQDSITYARAATRYKVRKGDTVQTVADNYGVPESMVRKWNHLKGDSLQGHTVVYVHLPVAPSAHGGPHSHTSTATASKHGKTKAASVSTVRHHTVKQGETLTSIANSYNTSVAALKRDNRNVASLHPGMVLTIR